MIESATLKKPTTLSHNSLLEQNKSLKEGEQATAADSETEVQIPSQIDIFNSYIPNLRETLVDQHDVAAKVASNTFSADKLVRMLSNTIKVFKSYSLVTHLKATDKLASQLGQLRRLLRVDRVIMIIRDYCHYFKKKRLSKFEMFLLAFKIMIFAEDLTDLRVFFIQLGALEGQQALGQLRKRIANLYFCECLGWLINYTHEYLRAQSQELKQKNLIIILRYIIDTIISHNQFSKRAFTLDTKITSCLGLCSSLLNLYLIWK